MKEIILIGGGGHCKSVIDVIEQEGKFKIAGIIEKDKSLIGNKVLNYEIIGCDADLKELRKKYNYALVTIGQIKNPIHRIRTFEKLKKLGFKLPSIISPLAYVSKYAFVDEGTVIMHFAIINANAKIGGNCIINTKALIEHDVTIGNHCHISTATVINGSCKIGNGVFIGSNAVIMNNISIVDNVIVGAGSIINKNIKEVGIYIGNPARRIK